MSGNPAETILEAINFFTVLGKIVRKAWQLFQRRSADGKRPVYDIHDVDTVMAEYGDTNALVINHASSEQLSRNDSESLVVAQGNRTNLFIGQFIVVLGQEPVALEDVQTLINRYSDDCELGFHVSRYAVRSVPNWPSVAQIVDSNRTFWGALKQMIEDNHREEEAEKADDDPGR